MTEAKVTLQDANFRAVLNDIAHDPRFTDGGFYVVTRFIAETASKTLGCSNTSIWTYTEDAHSGKSIRCMIRFHLETGEFSEGTTLGEQEAGSYLSALDRDTIIVIDDVKSDPRCSELNRGYLPENGIVSLLDAPFQFNGELAGVLCCEHTEDLRIWSIEEQHFAANMASLISIASERAQRRETEAMLREEEKRYRTLVQDLALGLAIVVNSEIVYANKTAAEISHLSDSESLRGLHLHDLFPGSSKEELTHWEKEFLSQPSQPQTVEQEFTLNDGSRIVVELTTSLVDWFGNPAIQAVFRDATEESYAQSRLKRSERLLSQAQRIARMGSWVWDMKTGETECSLELRNLLGIRGGNPLIEPISGIAHPEDLPRLKAAQDKAIQTGESYQLTYRVNTETGLLWLEEIGAPELGDRDEVIRIHGTSRDVTRQKTAELVAMATEERFSALGNTFPGGFVYCDLSNRFRFINKTFASWFGIDADEFLDQPISALIGKRAFAELEAQFLEVTQGNSIAFETTPTHMKEDIDNLQITLAPDVTVSGETRGYFALLTDTTPMKNMEQALRQAQRMEAMGQLTGGIAHDFNNILAILMGNLELASHTTYDAASNDYITAALQGVERGVALTQKLLGFARNSTPGTKEVKIDRVVDDLKDMIKQSIGGSINLSIEADDDLWMTEIDPGDFEGSLINLCTNARDAMPEGGRLMIKTMNRSLDDTSRAIHPSLHPGDYVLISVTDTGTGMDRRTQERLFDPFYTTKPEGKGTGLGMSMVFGFVKRSQGQTVVYSAENEGSTINIYLPRCSPTHEENREPPQGSILSTRHESVLIVDDEPMVANVAASILSELGYRTQTATTVQAALELLRKDSDIDLLLSDVVMPGDMNGFDLAKTASSIQPSLRILLTSGFSKFRGTEPTDEATRSLTANILTKPYNRQELAESVMRTLLAD